jgi:SnoaL-like domain
MTSGRDLADKQAIYEVVLRYCRGIDRLDMELVRSCYHPGAMDHHGGFEGERDQYVAWVGPALRRLRATQHLVANHLVELDGDRARSETYGTAAHLGDPAQGTESFTTGFRYVDTFERRDGDWRIVERFFLREWIRPEPDQRPGDPAESPVGARDRSDPVYRSLR